MESKRQQQLGSEIKRMISDLLRSDLSSMTHGAFVTISSVSLTQDLLLARILFSVLQKEKEQEVLANLRSENKYIRGLLGNKLKNKVRRIPEIEFYLDQSLEKVFEIEQLLKKTPTNSEEE